MEDPKRLEEGSRHAPIRAGEKVEDTTELSVDKSERVTTEQNEPHGDENPILLKKTSKRVATLDAFRGLTIVLMILVDDAGGVYERIDHSPWNGCTLADFVMPFFLFIVGVAIALALKRVLNMKSAVRKIIIRTLKMLFWGILLQGGYSHAPDDLDYGVDMKKIRWCGILQRIALVYMIVALIETFTTKLRPTTIESGHFSIFTAYRWQWLGGFLAFLIYVITTFTLYVPNWSYTIHHHHKSETFTACTLSSPESGPLRPDAPNWCRAPFEPEGLLSSISAILSGVIGIHYGHVLIHFKGHAERLKQWVSMGVGLLIIAILLHFTDAIPINKQLYSISYVCFTAGAAGIVFSAFYILIDVWGKRTPFLLFEWIGMNAMLVFVLGAQGILAGFVNGWYYDSADNNLVNWIQDHVFIDVWNSERVGSLLYVIFAEITFWGVLSGILHKLGIYWKL
ncbi:heparan-alpha-glucosaminide N-acetyltransferase isoform X2 [Helianthus annuus]|uniref:heparan-alpha-glucosaminide N-acetyltransferase isoform X2 n=1 Tax=Helianthus annuus TaxID=4232 RepID=UPI001652E9AD|nr:heparan-alpha-glucosaminide N-acetyltransferase isoform X2 [Helianthus annuus]